MPLQARLQANERILCFSLREGSDLHKRTMRVQQRREDHQWQVYQYQQVPFEQSL